MTRYAEVIGDPISHSKSPLIHRFWLQKLGIAADYKAHHVTAEDLPAYFADRIADPLWRGCNVTIPHKLAVLDHVADPGGVRDTIGAANTIFRNNDGALQATNTDAAGFFGPISDMDWTGAPVVVIGSGGAARAVLFALAQANVSDVTLMARNPLKGAALLARFGLKGQVLGMTASLPPAALVVNSSPLGMTGQEPLALDLAPLPDDAWVYDLVYAPLETGLLKAAKQRGLETVDGLEMLVGQAALAFEMFYGVAPPDESDEELRAVLLK
jgi:shikimate dehydrogenase